MWCLIVNLLYIEWGGVADRKIQIMLRYVSYVYAYTHNILVDNMCVHDIFVESDKPVVSTK